MLLYHFTNDYIEQFKHTKPKRQYSQASGKGIYFTTDYEKGLIKYGERSKYCYICEFTGNNILDLGIYDSMYFDGKMIHSSSIISENFRRYLNDTEQLLEPDIIIEKISPRAFKWLKSKGIQAIKGMEYEGYSCPEFCILDCTTINILRKTTNWISFKSTDFCEIGYNKNEQILQIKFNDGSIYQYFNIESSAFKKFIESKTQGLFFNKLIRGKFKYKRIK